MISSSSLVPTRRAPFFPLLGFGLAALVGCASIPERYEDAARDHGLIASEIRGDRFRHRIFQPPAGRRGGLLHIYIEGDGTPFLRANVPASDPTPRRPLMPALMARDPSARLLLGRPCHHGLARIAPCRPEDWTGGRFSAAIVDSMAQAARRLIEEGGYQGAALIGHSGGGVLALLLANRLPRVRAVVAVAAVTDIDFWARHHGLAPLADSLSPHRERPSRPGLPVLFLVGSEDRVTPPELVRHSRRSRPGGELRFYPGFDHACCWAGVWPETLAWIDARRSP